MQVDTLIPACNHYELIYSLIRPRIGKKTQLINPFATLAAEISSHALVESLATPAADGVQLQQFFVTSRTDHLVKSVNDYFNQPLELTQI